MVLKLLLTLSVASVLLEASIDLYQHRDFKGNGASIDVKGCVNLDKNFNDRASSVNTNGDCIILWNDIDCESGPSRSIRVAPGSPSHNDLSAIYWNDVTSSVSKCEDNYHPTAYRVNILNSEKQLENWSLLPFAEHVKWLMETECPIIETFFYGNNPRSGLNRTMNLKFDPKFSGAIEVTAGKITASVRYFHSHQHEALSFLHECSHVIQNYSVPVERWLVEGIASYYPNHIYEKSQWKPSEGQSFTEGYGSAAYLMFWVQTNRCSKYPHLAVSLNDKAWRGLYSDQSWVEICGKTPQEFWDEIPKLNS